MFGRAALFTQAEWMPAVISPYAWYDAELSSKTLSSTQVSQWNDISGTGLHLKQATSANQPIYSSADRWIDLDGSDDYMAPDTAFLPAGNNPFTIFSVVRWDVTDSSRFFFAQGAANNNQAVYVGSDTTTAGQPAFIMYGNRLNAGAFSAGVDYLMSYRYTSGAREFWQNGNSVASDAYSSLNLSTSSPYFGRFGTNYFNGKCRTLLVFRSALSVGNRQNVEGYLAWRWGLQGNLPGGHPYVNSPPYL
ncbi:hypothetical protein [Rhizobium sp. PAMB 3182]